MEKNFKDSMGHMRGDWRGSLDAMLKKWRDPVTVKETAKIVGLLALPACDQQGMGIAPDESFVNAMSDVT